MTKTETFEFMASFRGEFGPGAFSLIGERASQLGLEKPMIVCDETIVSLGLADRARELLARAAIEVVVFDRCTQNPKDSEINEGAALFKSERCDGVIGLGGGSSLDSAKVIRLVAKQGGTAADYDMLNGGLERIQQDQYPMIGVPTTAGTGAELTGAAVITNTDQRDKFIVAGPSLISSVILLDPELTVSMPPAVTAATGLDALVHAMEGYVSTKFNPLGASHCHRCFELIGQNLKKAVVNGADIEARSEMIQAAFLGGMVIKLKALGAVHALGHPLSSVCGIPHGTTLSIMLPHVMRFNAEAAETLYIEALRRMGFQVQSTEEAALAIMDFSRELGLPTTLTEVGVREQQLEELATKAIADMSLQSNPVAASRNDLLELYKNAM